MKENSLKLLKGLIAEREYGFGGGMDKYIDLAIKTYCAAANINESLFKENLIRYYRLTIGKVYNNVWNDNYEYIKERDIQLENYYRYIDISAGLVG